MQIQASIRTVIRTSISDAVPPHHRLATMGAEAYILKVKILFKSFMTDVFDEPLRSGSLSPDISVASEGSESSIQGLAVNEFPSQHVPSNSFALCQLLPYDYLMQTSSIDSRRGPLRTPFQCTNQIHCFLFDQSLVFWIINNPMRWDQVSIAEPKIVLMHIIGIDSQIINHLFRCNPFLFHSFFGKGRRSLGNRQTI